MKALYSILLVLFFILNGDAQSDTIKITGYNGHPASSDTTSDLGVAKISTKDTANSSGEEKKSAKKDNALLGVASFYSKNLEGTETSTGEIFHHNNLTAASNNYPLNTWVKVTNVRNGKSVIVRINDRMNPRMSKKGRVVDLTIAAARKIGLTDRIGITKVKVEPLDTEIAEVSE